MHVFVNAILAVVLLIGIVAPLLGAAAAGAAGTVSPTDDPVALGKALASDVEWIAGAEFLSRPASEATALVAGGIAGMPISGPSAVLLSTGDSRIITSLNDSGDAGHDLGGASQRGDTDFDVTVLQVDFVAPSTVNCLTGIDFRFLSEEYPEYVGSRYNDAFIAELDQTTWTTSGSDIIAPDNFAFDPVGSPITINAAGTTSMSAEAANGTTFDGATPLLTAATPLSPGPHSLYLSIFDQGDKILDSAVLVDNLRLGTVGDVATECKPGATVAELGHLFLPAVFKNSSQ